ncbi:PaeR7I family type II restriction endonuclease [Streptomyces scopuliridis]|uniref:PaeR7I family type II restriction endonuclease n=1 Tax=Streptomyces scopuliridis TaxID=452529 RepID=UPI0014032B6A|nr:PaeR7I family type II restriction endonuclease [Streptomyces scopuliridis]
MEPIVSATIDALVERGVDRSWIQTGNAASLPASFGLRDTRWDIVITKDDVPLGAIEFTAQSGSSAAKNLNNRIHEATSRALAVRSSDHNGGLQPQLGLFIMLEQGGSTSVQPRLEAALNQFLDDELYDEIAYTCYSDVGLREPSEGMSVQRFVDRFSRRLLARAVGPLEEITPNLERYREVIEAARGEKKDYSLERVPKRGGQAEVLRGGCTKRQASRLLSSGDYLSGRRQVPGWGARSRSPAS